MIKTNNLIGSKKLISDWLKNIHFDPILTFTVLIRNFWLRGKSCNLAALYYFFVWSAHLERL
jgi:hypothetical protein